VNSFLGMKEGRERNPTKATRYRFKHTVGRSIAYCIDRLRAFRGLPRLRYKDRSMDRWIKKRTRCVSMDLRSRKDHLRNTNCAAD
jgi:hypothetical protein